MSTAQVNGTAEAAATVVKALVWELKAEELLTYVCVTILALIPIYIGCHMSLTQKKEQKEGSEGGNGSKIEYELETMSSSDAWKFPVYGSAFLFGLYVVYKLLPKEWVTLCLNLYLLCFGMASLVACFRPLYSKIFNLFSQHEHVLPVWKLTVPYLIKEPVDVTYLDALNVFGCVALVSWYLWTKNWIANNIIATSFSIQGIALVSVGSYQIGCGLLSLLFFYDIFWVFGTDVMVTVAKSFDGPIKMLWPKDLLADQYSFSMLGLGDIVLPGLFLALLLRYDVHRSKDKKSFQSPYFNVTFFGYIVGLAVTMSVMHIFRAAQPALLYLVPAVILFSAGTGFYLRDFSGIWNYSEDSDEDKKKDEKKVKKE